MLFWLNLSPITAKFNALETNHSYFRCRSRCRLLSLVFICNRRVRFRQNYGSKRSAFDCQHCNTAFDGCSCFSIRLSAHSKTTKAASRNECRARHYTGG